MGLFDWFGKTSGGGQEVFTDDRDGQKYRTVKIGEQVWMAENFRYKSKSYEKQTVWNYDYSREKIKQYGCLYSWSAAKDYAPEGWRLPTFDDFRELLANVYKMKKDEIYSKRMMNEKDSGKSLRLAGPGSFGLQFGGMYNELYSPDGIGHKAFLWTSSRGGVLRDRDDEHFYFTMWYDLGMKFGFDYMADSQLLSVRYIKA